MFRRAITRTILIRSGAFIRVGRSFQTDKRAERACPGSGTASNAFVRPSDPGNDRLGRQLEPGGEIDLRFVAEDLARGADVRPRVADVAGPRRLEALLDGLAEDDSDRLGDVVDARRRARRDVERAPVRADSLRGADRRVDDVGDIREVARLLAVAVDRDRLPRVDRRDEERHRRGVLRVRALPWPEDVEVTQYDRFERVVHAAEADAVALGRELCDAVRGDRVGRSRL